MPYKLPDAKQEEIYLNLQQLYSSSSMSTNLGIQQICGLVNLWKMAGPHYRKQHWSCDQEFIIVDFTYSLGYNASLGFIERVKLELFWMHND